MHRTPEPELMEAPDQALAYAQVDFSSTDAALVEAFFERLGPDPCGPVLDLGCGPGNICRRVARALPRRQVVGVDEIRSQLDRCGLGALTVEPRGDRHVWIWGRLKG